MKKALFSIAYLAPIDYWAALVKCDEIMLESHESFLKQSFRNRTYIDSPNDVLRLNFPISHGQSKVISNIAISYGENWTAKHWQAIKTAYSSSPFFEEIADDLLDVYKLKHTCLWDFNFGLMQVVFRWLNLKTKVTTTEEWKAFPKNTNDLRNTFHPKIKSMIPHFPSYPQVFDTKHDFRPNLSIIDLVFNEGPAAYDYLINLDSSALLRD